MRAKQVSDRVSTVAIDRPPRGFKPVGEQGSSRRLIPCIPNSCAEVKSAFGKAGTRKVMSEIFVGIDVSKDQLDIAASNGERWCCANREGDFLELIERLRGSPTRERGDREIRGGFSPSSPLPLYSE